MATPSPFEIGRGVGSNISEAIRGSREQRALEDILSQVQSGEAPQNIGAILNQFSPERQQLIQQSLASQARRRAYAAQGLDPSIADLDPAIQKEIIKRNSSNVKSEDTELGNALAALDNYENLLNSDAPGIGFGGKWNPSDKARFNRGQVEAMELSLLPLVKKALGGRITNKQEFERAVSKYIPQVGDTFANARGKIAELRRVASQSGLTQNYVDQKAQATGQTQKQADRPPLDSFYR